MRYIWFILLIGFAGCFQAYDAEDEELRTVPVTNNPHVVPNHGSGIPGIPSSPQGPY